MKQQIDWKEWMEQAGRELYNREAYTSLLPNLADLHRVGREYQSKYKLDGNEAKNHRKDKTYIPESRPMMVQEHGDRAYNIVKWVMDNQHRDFIDVAKQIAELTNMELPQGNDWQNWLEKQQQKELVATVQEYYHYCLQHAPEGIKTYLHSRFTDAEVEAMGLGWIASQDKLKDYLTKMHYTQEQVEQFAATMPYNAGSTNQITIPIYRAGNIYSFIYRHHNQEGLTDEQRGKKYLYHKGKDRMEIEHPTNDKLGKDNPYAVELTAQFAYIPSRLPRENKGLVIVEGQLDCLHLLAAGIKNVVAAGTHGVNTKAVEDAIKRGYRTFTIMFDADPIDTEPDKNYKAITAAAHTIIETAQRMGKADEVQVNIAELLQTNPAEKIDPDSYIRANGAAAVDSLLERYSPLWQYELHHAINKLDGVQELTPKMLDGFKAEVMDIYDIIPDYIGREQYKHAVASVMNLNNADGTATPIDPKAIERMLDEHQQKQKQEKAQKEAKELMLEAGKLYGEGNIAKADALKEKADTIMGEARAALEYEQIRKPTTQADIYNTIRNAPDAIHTGLHLGKPIEDNELLIPSGALTVIAAPSSHGKTAMLIALAVDEARKHQDKEYYILHYEDTEGMMAIRAANCYAGIKISDRNEQTILNKIKQGGWGRTYVEEKPDTIKAYDQEEANFYKLMEQGTLHIKHTEMCCEALCSTIVKLATSGKLGGVFIDYIQRIPLQNTKGTFARHEEIARICQMLEAAAAETGTPIVITSQYNREVTDPTKMHPTKMAEGASIERIAANIWGIWNTDMAVLAPDSVRVELDKYYRGLTVNPDLKDSKNRNNAAIVVVHKNRHGIGAAANAWGLLHFNLNTGMVKDYDKALEEDNELDF